MRERPGDEHLIEMLPADDAAWGPSAPPANLPTDSARRRRRRTVLTGVVAALAVAAVTFVAVGGDEESGSTVTTTPATSGPADSRREGATGASPYFVIDDPALRPYSADVVTPRPADARFSIWSDGDARSPWLSLQLQPAHSERYVFPDSARRVVGGHELITARAAPFATEIVVGDGSGPTVLVRGVGIPAVELSALADSITATATSVDFDEAITSRLGLTLTTQVGWSSELLYGVVKTQMSALTGDGALVVLRVAEGRTDPRPATLAFVADGPITNGDGYTIARLPASGASIVTWAEGGHLLSLEGPLSPRALLRVARRVRRAPADEWRQLLYGLHPDYRIGEFVTLAQGELQPAGSTEWQAGAQVATRGGRTLSLWWWTAADDAASSAARLVDGDLVEEPRLDTVVVRGATYVFVSVPAGHPAQHASVRVGDGSIVEVPLTQPFDGVPVRMGATRTAVPGEVSAWFDGEGAEPQPAG